VLGVPFLRRRTWRLAVLKSTCSPPQVANFRCPKAVPEGQEHHQCVAMPIAIALGRLDEPLDLVDGQVLSGPKLAIFASAQRNCSIFSCWSDQSQAWFGHENPSSCMPHCSIHRHFMNSCERQNGCSTSKKDKHGTDECFGWKLIDSQESFARVAVFLATCTVGVVLWPRVRFGKVI
jgi:hypothetical protein